MSFMKKYSFVFVTIVSVLIMVFLPGFLMEKADEKEMGKIRTDKVSSGRNALLTVLSFEERVELYCNAHINQTLLLGRTENAQIESIKVMDETKTEVEYIYAIEDADVYERYEEEFKTLYEMGVIPDFMKFSETEVTGERMYLYSKKEEKGAVFVCINQKGMTKDNENMLIRFVADEESGKIIAIYVEKEPFFKGKTYGVFSSEKFFDYLGVDFEMLGIKKKEEYYEMKNKMFSYWVFYEEKEMGIFPMK